MAHSTEINKLREIHQEEEALFEEAVNLHGDNTSEAYQKFGPVAILFPLEQKVAQIEHITSHITPEGLDTLRTALMELANQASISAAELRQDLQVPGEIPEKTPKKNRKKRKSKEEKTVEPTAPTEKKEGGPMDNLSKKQLSSVLMELGGKVPPKASREDLISAISKYPKAQVAVAITSLNTGEEDSQVSE